MATPPAWLASMARCSSRSAIRVLVGPTASYEWVNSTIVKTVGGGPSASGSTTANDLNFTGEYTVNGNRVSILVSVQPAAGSSCRRVQRERERGGNRNLRLLTSLRHRDLRRSKASPRIPTETQRHSCLRCSSGNGNPAFLTFNSASINYSGPLIPILPEMPVPTQCRIHHRSDLNGQRNRTLGPVTDLALGGPLPLTFRRFYSSFLGGALRLSADRV